MEKKMLYNIATGVVVIAGAFAVGIIPTIANMPIAGTSLSVLMGLGLFGVAYGLYNRKI